MIYWLSYDIILYHCMQIVCITSCNTCTETHSKNTSTSVVVDVVATSQYSDSEWILSECAGNNTPTNEHQCCLPVSRPSWEWRRSQLSLAVRKFSRVSDHLGISVLFTKMCRPLPFPNPSSSSELYNDTRSNQKTNQSYPTNVFSEDSASF